MTGTDTALPLASRVLARLLDHRKTADCLWLAGFAALPMALAAALGAFETVDGFIGYRDRLNWTSLVLVLPAAVFALRWIMRHIGPVSAPSLPDVAPPIVTLIATNQGRQAAYLALRHALLSPRNLHAALLITLVAQVADMAQISHMYLSGPTALCTASAPATAAAPPPCANELALPGVDPRLVVTLGGQAVSLSKDWGTLFLSAKAGVSKGANLALILVAYSVQAAVIFIGLLFLVLVLRHNLFFLSRIYQRRWVEPGNEPAYIHIDLDDEEDCFGFRRANDAFNVQVLALVLAAVFMLASRFTVVEPGRGLFPELGQALMVVAWMVGLVVISLPILVKLLPRLPAAGEKKPPASLVAYLREFLSEEAWDVKPNTPAAEIDSVAARFAENAFWPTGNNRAWQLYFLSFWIFFIALVPDPRALDSGLPSWSRGVGWLAAGGLAWVATWGLFRLLQAMLTWVDHRLAGPLQRPGVLGGLRRRRKIPIGLFISYRRADSAAYTGRLYDGLARHLDPQRVFMDQDTIPGGADFVAVIQQSINSSQAMIVVIGPEWLSLSHEGQSVPRIQDTTDVVHQEIALALKQGLQVFPVLVGRATMPGEADLPEALKPLARRNARELSDSRWAHDLGLLVKDLETVVPVKGV